MKKTTTFQENLSKQFLRNVFIPTFVLMVIIVVFTFFLTESTANAKKQISKSMVFYWALSMNIRAL